MLSPNGLVPHLQVKQKNMPRQKLGGLGFYPGSVTCFTRSWALSSLGLSLSIYETGVAMSVS